MSIGEVKERRMGGKNVLLSGRQEEEHGGEEREHWRWVRWPGKACLDIMLSRNGYK